MSFFLDLFRLHHSEMSAFKYPSGICLVSVWWESSFSAFGSFGPGDEARYVAGDDGDDGDDLISIIRRCVDA